VVGKRHFGGDAGFGRHVVNILNGLGNIKGLRAVAQRC
jgi:hypothetical protein